MKNLLILAIACITSFSGTFASTLSTTPNVEGNSTSLDLNDKEKRNLKKQRKALKKKDKALDQEEKQLKMKQKIAKDERKLNKREKKIIKKESDLM